MSRNASIGSNSLDVPNSKSCQTGLICKKSQHSRLKLLNLQQLQHLSKRPVKGHHAKFKSILFFLRFGCKVRKFDKTFSLLQIWVRCSGRFTGEPQSRNSYQHIYQRGVRRRFTSRLPCLRVEAIKLCEGHISGATCILQIGAKNSAASMCPEKGPSKPRATI